MALFQTSVIKTYLAQQDPNGVERAYKKYTKYFHNTTIQENIKNSKEEQYQAKFLDELFVNILDYTLNPKPDFNITTEFKNQKGAGKADGAILKETTAIGVIELKGTNTKDLESIRKQAFDYKANQKGCVYVITSNFEKLRFYINDATEFLEFNLFQLAAEEFALLYLCLYKDNILNNLPLNIKEASLVAEEKITKQFYNDYSVFKRELFRDLVKRNAKRLKQNAEIPQEAEVSEDTTELKALEKNVKLALFKKSQKLIDRFLFIFFAEDRDLLPPNSTIQILDKWKADNDFGDERPLYNLFKQYFHFLDEGRKGTNSRAEIYAYNGGLFKPDNVLDHLEIDNALLYKHTYQLAKYDFSSQVDVNILGHIFENSLNEIESVNAEIEGGEFDKQKSKRKKDGVFYTPKYITKYIVENTVGKLCQEKKDALGFKEEAYFEVKKGTHITTKKQLLEVLDAYREWLLQLTICDPACGSGAFLNQALDFLIKEHRYLDELKAKVLGGGLILSDIENTILENNIYGVDLNEESFEIAKLSLWLRTAQPRRKLNNLSHNIKCGNSLIDDKKVAGDKAFNWQQEFPQVFREKDKHAYHLVFTTHNSRWSGRMSEKNIKKGPPLELHLEQEIALTEIIKAIVLEKGYSVLAYNICKDHVHLVLVCAEDEVFGIAKILKGKSSYLYQSKGFKPLGDSLWSQKFFFAQLDELVWAGVSPLPGQVFVDSYLDNAITYVKHNRAKHKLPASAVLNDLISEMLSDQNTAFATEYTGGFDVVIGNPPYVRHELISDYKDFLSKNYSSYQSTADLYVYFLEKGMNLLRHNGLLGYITPNKFTNVTYGLHIRKILGNDYSIEKLIDFGELPVFADAATFPFISIIRNKFEKGDIDFVKINTLRNLDISTSIEKDGIKVSAKSLFGNEWNLISKNESKVLSKILSIGKPINKYLDVEFYRGILTGYNEAFIIDETIRKQLIEEDYNSTEIIKPFVDGDDVRYYHLRTKGKYIIFTRRGIDIEKYPAIKKYLNQFYDRLKPKESKADKIGRKKGDYKWYEIQDSISYYKEFDKPKIIYPEIAKESRFTIDLNKTYLNKTIFFIPIEDYFLLGVLNSKLVWFFLCNTCTSLGDPKNGGRLNIQKVYLEKTPIPADIEDKNKNELVRKSKLLFENQNVLYNQSKSFTSYIMSSYNIEKLSRKLENWHELDFADFIKELNKAIKKAGGTALTKKDEFEWLELFEDNKTKAQALQSQITQTEKEIDTMVYDLYGLTEEERDIVENS